jgi:hypothetical protein
MRATLTFSAGANFSLGRDHLLCLLHDPIGKSKARVVGQPIDFIDPREANVVGLCERDWVTFVERHWSAGDATKLEKRTSLAFPDMSPAGLDRIGALYNRIDDIHSANPAGLLAFAFEQLQSEGVGVEQEITDEFLAKASQELTSRFAVLPWAEVRPHWQMLREAHARSDRGRAFARPIIEQAVRRAMGDDPLAAANAALDIASSQGAAGATSAMTALFDDALKRLAAWVTATPNADHDLTLAVCRRWQRLRQDCPIIEGIRNACAKAASAGQPSQDAGLPSPTGHPD